MLRQRLRVEQVHLILFGAQVVKRPRPLPALGQGYNVLVLAM